MSLEGLLAFVAVLAIARPIQRDSLKVFVPWRWLAVSLFVSFILIVCKDGPFAWNPLDLSPRSLEVLRFCLGVLAFLFPVTATIACWIYWHKATLSDRNMNYLADLLKASLREGQFDEAERILQRNKDSLKRLPRETISALFSPRIVEALIDSRSLVHMELLRRMDFLESLSDRHGPVNTVLRKLLCSEISPLRAVVVSQYGGYEHLDYSATDRALIKDTLENPC